jgi:predicted transcriptional regulator
MVKNEEFGYNNNSKIRFDEFSSSLLRRAKKYSIYSRTLTINDAISKKKLSKITSGDLDFTYEFLKAFYAIRRLKHRVGNIKYDENHADWPTIKTLGGNLKEFYEAFEFLEPKNAAKEFVTLLFDLSPKAIINYWPKTVSKVTEVYEAKLIVKNDKYQEETQTLHTLYRQSLIDKVGLSNDYRDTATVYQHFVKATQMCKEELHCSLDLFIKAQFEGLAWSGGYPQPAQLVTDTAKERVIKYAFQNNLTLKQKPETAKVKVDWKKLRKNK